jgi:hypothetical protein
MTPKKKVQAKKTRNNFSLLYVFHEHSKKKRKRRRRSLTRTANTPTSKHQQKSKAKSASSLWWCLEFVKIIDRDETLKFMNMFYRAAARLFGVYCSYGTRFGHVKHHYSDPPGVGGREQHFPKPFIFFSHHGIFAHFFRFFHILSRALSHTNSLLPVLPTSGTWGRWCRSARVFMSAAGPLENKAGGQKYRKTKTQN